MAGEVNTIVCVSACVGAKEHLFADFDGRERVTTGDVVAVTRDGDQGVPLAGPGQCRLARDGARLGVLEPHLEGLDASGVQVGVEDVDIGHGCSREGSTELSPARIRDKLSPAGSVAAEYAGPNGAVMYSTLIRSSLAALVTVSLAGVASGCVHPAPPVAVVDPGAAPHLPAPVADLYVHHVGTPVDPLVKQLIGARPWEEVLSGAATALALKIAARESTDLLAARWAAVRAGYPYPVERMEIVHTAHDELPQLVVPATGDIGLVRARGPDDDIWVLLHGRSGAALPPIPREAQVGDAVRLGLHQWRAGSPDGSVFDVGETLVFNRAGEWLLQARGADGVIANLPVYVGQPMPEVSPLLSVLTGKDPEEATFNAVAGVWKWYGREAPQRDSGVDSVARVRLREAHAANAGGAAAAPAAALLRRAGFVEGGDGSECQAATLLDCLEQMWWSPDQRAVFASDYRSVGVAMATEAGGVHVVVMAAR